MGLHGSVSAPKGILVQVAVSFLQREKEPLLSGWSGRAAGKSRLPSFWSHTRAICLCACLPQELFPYLGHCLPSLPSPEPLKASLVLPGRQAFSLASQLCPFPRHPGRIFSILSLKFLATSWGHGPLRCLPRADTFWSGLHSFPRAQNLRTQAFPSDPCPQLWTPWTL